MAVAVDATGTDVNTGSGSTSTSLSGSIITVGSGANRALVAGLLVDSGSITPTMTWDPGGTNQSMTLIASDSSGLSFLFGLVNPVSGAKVLKADWTGQTAQNAYLGAISFTGANQTGGTISFAHANSNKFSTTGTTANVNMTSAVGNWLVAAFSVGSGGLTLAFGQSQVFRDGAISDMTGGMSQVTGAASVNMTASWTGATVWFCCGLDVVAAGAGTQNTLVGRQPLVNL